MHLLFVYGSLKQGFPNHHANRGVRVPGSWRTAEPHPLYLADARLPCLLPRPGEGHRVVGELFEVATHELLAMDALERVGEPGGYARIVIDVERTDSQPGQLVQAFVYVQDPERLAAQGPHVGPLEEYTFEHAKSLRW